MNALEACQHFKQPENQYERNILKAACQMVAAENWDARYLTQYASGTTLWEVERSGKFIKVTYPGEPT